MKNKKRILKTIGIISCVGLISTSFSACQKQTTTVTDEIAANKIEESLISYLKTDDYVVDELKEYNYTTDSEFTDEDKTFLTETFGEQNATVKRLEITFTTTSLNQNIQGKYCILFGYLSSGWTALKGYGIDADNWLFEAREPVSTVEIVNTLKEIEFEGFEKGKIGDELTTSIEIVNRTKNLEAGKDQLDINVKYNAGFANYTIGVHLQYEFVKGEWILYNSSVDDPTFWVVSYGETEPEAPKEDYILNALSNSSQFETYMMNMQYVENQSITFIDKLSQANTLTYNYLLVVNYHNFGQFSYDISKTYTYESNQWVEGPLNVSLKNVNISEMIDTWSSTSDFITFNQVDNQDLTGVYVHKYDDTHNVQYDIKAHLEVPLTDNQWPLTVEKVGVHSGAELEEFVILPFTVDLSEGRIISNGNIFKAEGNKYIDNQSVLIGNNNEDTPIQTTAPVEEPIQTETTTEEYDSGLDFFS